LLGKSSSSNNNSDSNNDSNNHDNQRDDIEHDDNVQTQSQKQNSTNIHWLPCHAIDLKKDGELNAHVDSVRFSGDLVACLSLLSLSIMRLKLPPPPKDESENENNNENDNNENNNNNSHNGDDNDKNDNNNNDNGNDGGYVDLLLPPQSLYVLTGDGRYKYSHELLPDGSTFTFRDTTSDTSNSDNNDTTSGTSRNHNEHESNSSSSSSSIVVHRDHRLSIIFRDAKEQL